MRPPRLPGSRSAASIEAVAQQPRLRISDRRNGEMVLPASRLQGHKTSTTVDAEAFTQWICVKQQACFSECLCALLSAACRYIRWRVPHFPIAPATSHCSHAESVACLTCLGSEIQHACVQCPVTDRRLYGCSGNGIIRVDVTADGGKTWTSANLKHHAIGQKRGR